jgi:hypothetical protein
MLGHFEEKHGRDAHATSFSALFIHPLRSFGLPPLPGRLRAGPETRTQQRYPAKRLAANYKISPNVLRNSIIETSRRNGLYGVRNPSSARNWGSALQKTDTVPIRR